MAINHQLLERVIELGSEIDIDPDFETAHELWEALQSGMDPADELYVVIRYGSDATAHHVGTEDILRELSDAHCSNPPPTCVDFYALSADEHESV